MKQFCCVMFSIFFFSILKISAVNYIITGPSVTVTNATDNGAPFYYNFSVKADDGSVPKGTWTSSTNASFSGAITETSCKVRWTRAGITSLTYSNSSISINFIIYVINQSTITYTYDCFGNRVLRQKEIRLKSFSETDSVLVIDSVKKNGNPLMPLSFSNVLTDSVQNIGKISVYPNPTRSEVFVELQKQDTLQSNISVFTSQGVLLFCMPAITDGKTILNFSNQASGKYLMVIYSGNKTSTWDIIKED